MSWTPISGGSRWHSWRCSTRGTGTSVPSRGGRRCGQVTARGRGRTENCRSGQWCRASDAIQRQDSFPSRRAAAPRSRDTSRLGQALTRASRDLEKTCLHRVGHCRQLLTRSFSQICRVRARFGVDSAACEVCRGPIRRDSAGFLRAELALTFNEVRSSSVLGGPEYPSMRPKSRRALSWPRSYDGWLTVVSE